MLPVTAKENPEGVRHLYNSKRDFTCSSLLTRRSVSVFIVSTEGKVFKQKLVHSVALVIMDLVLVY